MSEKKENFFKKAFREMKESAKAQHKVDKANFNAVKAESKANWEEAKLSPSQRRVLIEEEQQEQIAEANKREAEANARIERVKNLHGK